MRGTCAHVRLTRVFFSSSLGIGLTLAALDPLRIIAGASLGAQPFLSSSAMPEWTPSSWRAYPVKQQPVYPDAVALEAAAAEVRRLPPLVTASEVDELRAAMAEVALGKRFLLQGGDCAERFMVRG